MAAFNYTARTKTNTLQKGMITAKDRLAALSTLKDRGLLPILVKEEGARAAGTIKFSIPFLKRKVKARDLAIFTRELATMINAGVPIVKSLHTMQVQTESPALRKILDVISAKIEGGAPLSDALSAHPKVFSPVYVNMVRAGETGGILDQILERLAVQVEKDNEIKSKLRGAMIYPSVITVITFGAFIFLMTGIVPKLKDIFDQYQAELPLNTRIMLFISEALQKYGVVIAIGAAVLIFLLVRLIRRPKGKLVFDRVMLKLPIFGKIILKVNVARFARTFSSLTSAGVGVLDSLTVTSQSLNNVIIKNAIKEAAEKVRNGQPVSAALAEHHVFPPMITQMTAIGEETGQVDKVLGKVAEFYEKEVDRVISNLTSIIEPLLIVVLGGLVGLVVASVFGPISELTNVVK